MSSVQKKTVKEDRLSHCFLGLALKINLTQSNLPFFSRVVVMKSHYSRTDSSPQSIHKVEQYACTFIKTHFQLLFEDHDIILHTDLVVLRNSKGSTPFISSISDCRKQKKEGFYTVGDKALNMAQKIR